MESVSGVSGGDRHSSERSRRAQSILESKQVDSGRPAWNLVATGATALLELGPGTLNALTTEHHLEAYADIPDELKLEYRVGEALTVMPSFNRTDVFSEAKAIRTWADFWNAEEFFPASGH